MGSPRSIPFVSMEVRILLFDWVRKYSLHLAKGTKVNNPFRFVSNNKFVFVFCCLFLSTADTH